jgi:hypothetical protein
MIKKLKQLMVVFLIVGLIILIKAPIIGGIILCIVMVFYPFFMLLDKGTTKAKDTNKATEE